MRRFSKSIWIIAALGVTVRLVSFFQNRSLWLDEILLALNVIQRSFGELATPPLLLHQMAPVGFLFLSKAVVNILGPDEMALRLVPLLAGIAGVAVFPFLAEKCLRREAIPYAVGFFALSFALIYYSNEFKQYSLDGLSSVLLYLVGFSILQSEKPMRFTPVIQLLAVTFSCLTSFPAFFVASSLLIILIPNALTGKHWEKLPCLGLITCSMIFCFWAVYETSFSAIEPGALQSFLSDWQRAHAFMPIPAPGEGRLIWFLTKPIAPLQMVHPALEMQGLLAFVWVVGAASLIRSNHQKMVLLLLPATFALLASAFEIYPWSGRFLVFLTPSVCLILGEGTRSLICSLRKKTPIVAGFLCTVLFLSVLGVDAYDMAFVRSKENPRTVFQFIQENGNPYDVLYLYDYCVHHYRYYSKTIDLGNPTIETGKNAEPEFFHEHFPHQRVWVVYSTYSAGLKLGQELRKHFRVIDSTTEKGMEALLIDCETFR